MNNDLHRLIKDDYSLDDIIAIENLLISSGTFDFLILRNGLFPAANYDESEKERSCLNYNFVWLRDNIHISLAHYCAGKEDIALMNIRSLVRFYQHQIPKIDAIIQGKVSPGEIMKRPHIRFCGDTLEEFPEAWPHAQNDAPGAFIWFMMRLFSDRKLAAGDDVTGLIVKFIEYFRAIKYWKDEDSGHWEEERKISASSIGVVLSALKAVKEQFDTLMPHNKVSAGIERTLDFLIRKGQAALKKILPFECIQAGKKRKYDAALLFLAYPFRVLDMRIEDAIIDNVTRNLASHIGIKRYTGDSYWCADYKLKLAAQDLTRDFSNDLEARNALFTPGTEAQWCIFDPVLSVIYGRRYMATADTGFFRKQVYHFNRSLHQITGKDCTFGAFKCPEAYYLSGGKWIPNDATPLQWTQANLVTAFIYMKKSCLLRRTP